MALVIADRVRETSTTTGTGNFTLGGAVGGFESFLSAVGEGNTCYYTIAGGTEWEVGLGTITSGELVRTTVYKSSNADAAVDFSAGTKDVFVTYPGDKAVFKDASGNVNALGTITSGVWNGTEITVPYGGTGAASFTAGALLKGNGQSAIAEAVAGTDYVTPSGTETLTNKTIAFSSNTLTDVASTSTAQTLTNKTLADPKISLGGTNGTAGQVPVSQGSGLSPVWGSKQDTLVSGTNIKTINGSSVLGSGDLTVGGGGSMVLLSTVTANNSATIDIESTFDSTYDEYVILITSVKLTSTVSFLAQMKLGGSYLSSGYQYSQITSSSSSTTVSSQASSSSTFLFLTNVDIGTGTSDSGNYVVRIFNPTSTTLKKIISWEGMTSNSTLVQNLSGRGLNTSTGALTGIRFYPGGGSIASGSFRLYGISKS